MTQVHPELDLPSAEGYIFAVQSSIRNDDNTPIVTKNVFAFAARLSDFSEEEVNQLLQLLSTGGVIQDILRDEPRWNKLALTVAHLQQNYLEEVISAVRRSIYDDNDEPTVIQNVLAFATRMSGCNEEEVNETLMPGGIIPDIALDLCTVDTRIIQPDEEETEFDKQWMYYEDEDGKHHYRSESPVVKVASFFSESDDEMWGPIASTTWCKLALTVAHKSKKIKRFVKRCLACSFSPFVELDKFTMLQSTMSAFLLMLGEPLQQYYVDNKLGELLSTPSIGLPPSRTDYSSSPGGAMYQKDLPLPPLDVEKEWDEDELLSIHILRLVAAAVNPLFQGITSGICSKHNGAHKGAAIKGYTRMVDKLNNEDDHGNLPWQRPLHNIDVVRNCCTFDQPSDLVAFARALCDHPSLAGGPIRLKNGFMLSEEAASKFYHYRTAMINVRFAPEGLTYGALFSKPEVEAMLDEAENAASPNGSGPMGGSNDVVWHTLATKAVAFLRSDVVANLPVVLVCESQLLLKPYLDARQAMHLPYKIVRIENTQQKGLGILGEIGMFGENPFTVMVKQFYSLLKEEKMSWSMKEQKSSRKRLEAVENDETCLFEELISAAEGNEQQAFRELLPRGLKQYGSAVMTMTCASGYGTLLNAVQGNFVLLQVLLDAGAQVFCNDQDAHSNWINHVGHVSPEQSAMPPHLHCTSTALGNAISAGHAPIVRLLLSQKYIAVDSCALGMCCGGDRIQHFGNHLNVIRLLLAQNVVDINGIIGGRYKQSSLKVEDNNGDGFTLLSSAIKKNHLPVVRFLLSQDDIDVNLGDRKEGHSPLYWASYHANLPAMRLLLVHPKLEGKLVKKVYKKLKNDDYSSTDQPIYELLDQHMKNSACCMLQ